MELAKGCQRTTWERSLAAVQASPKVVRVEVRDSALTETELLRLAAAADRRSAHPLAKAVVEHAARLTSIFDRSSPYWPLARNF